ncbi:MAG: helix-turn-helix transcriptional regulator [Candidatus Zixiibacteriota bacterium]|nr:MAG: helix-turn-helix transcriptional regulator [candidate division Zixibacteria bacterium]
MEIRINLDMVLVKRKMSLTELAGRVGISVTNLSLLKTGKVRGIRFSTLAAICRELECQPADILEYVPESSQSAASISDYENNMGTGGT